MSKRNKGKRWPPHEWPDPPDTNLQYIIQNRRHLNNVDMQSYHHSKYWGSTATAVGKQAITTYHRITEWDATMARKTYRIELKIDFEDDTRHEHMLTVARNAARDLISVAMLLQDGRKPQIALITDDTFIGSDEIEIQPIEATE